MILENYQEGENFVVNIKESKYKKVNIKDVAEKQTHLTKEQCTDLFTIFLKRTNLFSGKLGKYPHKKMDLELLPDVKSIHCQPYPIPQNHLGVFHKELEHLCDLGILSCFGATEWASPTFIIPKKDGRVCWVSDFCELNKVIRHKKYPLLRIQGILKK
jgi:hypothetical protein